MLFLLFLTILQTAAQEDPVVPVLRAIFNQHPTVSHHTVLILRDVEVLKTLLPDQPTRLIIKDKTPIRIQHTRGLIIFIGMLNISEILSMTEWTPETQFLLVQPSINTDNFVLNFKYQDSENHSLIMTPTDIFTNFRNLLTPDSPDSSPVWQNTKQVMREFWSKRIQNVVVIMPQQTNIYLYAIFPFSDHRCQDEILPTLINIWSSTTESFYKQLIPFPDKLGNLFGCPLEVCVVEVPPGLMLKDRMTLDGIEGKLVHEILSALNATLRINVKQDPKWFGNFTAMDHLFREITLWSSDIGAGLLLPTFPDKETDNVNFCTTVCLAWAVPNQLVPKSAFLVMADVFEPIVWYWVGFSIIAAMVVSAILAHVEGRPCSEVMKIFSITFGQSTRLPRVRSLKILFCNFMWFVLAFSMVYQAGFGSNRIVLRPAYQLKTPRDVLESEIELAGSFTAKRIFDRQNDNKINIRGMDTQNGLTKVAYEQKTAFLGIRITSKYFTRIITPDLRDLVYLQEECLIQYHPALALKHSSPYTAIAKSTVELLVEAGIVDHETKMYMTRVNFRHRFHRRHVRREPPPSVVIALHSIIRYGFGLSLFVFLAEHVLYYIGTRYREQQGLWVHH